MMTRLQMMQAARGLWLYDSLPTYHNVKCDRADTMYYTFMYINTKKRGVPEVPSFPSPLSLSLSHLFPQGHNDGRRDPC